VLSTISVADVTVREGPTSLGVLDPSGAANLGINGMRDMAFTSKGDLLVGGYTSASVIRFDWASQTYQPFITSGSGGLAGYSGVAFDPSGNVYVASYEQNEIFRYDPTGAPLPAPGQPGALYAQGGGLSGLGNIAFGPDGNLYAVSGDTSQILRYQGPSGSSPGAFMDAIVNHTINIPNRLTFGPDHNLYVAGPAVSGSTLAMISRYDGLTGQPIGNGAFVPAASGGLQQTREFLIDPQGTYLYVVEAGPAEVLRFQGPNGPNPGAFVDTYITQGQAGLSVTIGMTLDSTGNLYVSERDLNEVTRFAPSSEASFTVTLDSASTAPISVSYATANGTAVAGTDYTQTSGTLDFAPGVTSQTVNVPITTVATGGPTRTFTMNLSDASGATISRGHATGSILNRMTKFFVADSGTPATYQYGSGGTSEEITPESSGNTAPRGVATTAAGTTVWVVDANKNVYVSSNHGTPLGSWSAGGLSSSATLTGITTNGTDIWLVDSYAGKVYKYAGAASRLSGSQNAASSFSLASGKNGNSSPQDLVTDGTSFWVVDGSKLKVFKYTLSGSSLGSWSIDPANTHPTGITINPTNVSDIWIVDNGTNKVYQYIGAASRTSGSQTAGATFALAGGNTNPQGIADPPPADTILTPVAAPLTPNPSATAALDTVSSVGPSVSAGPSSVGSRDAVLELLAGGLLPAAGGNTPSLTTGEALAPWLAMPTTSPPGIIPLSGFPGSAAGLRADAPVDEESQASAVTDTVFASLAADALADQ
jgi:hypothetical protein